MYIPLWVVGIIHVSVMLLFAEERNAGIRDGIQRAKSNQDAPLHSVMERIVIIVAYGVTWLLIMAIGPVTHFLKSI